ncbi:hypothetical protein [Streptomyces sp. Ru72]|uniref:hypothetical protein n=1 Tax=Streptomyces sp. Ru72 TaxID=2080747 RepID=UPI000CDD330D|nr:hypothetical protein [Streptomyces sp. Ru72]POX44211.1 hypothetical protein C3488_33565 [Streptomyces sp. Ru72]
MTTSDLSADWLTTWQREITTALEQTLHFFESTLGYSPGARCSWLTRKAEPHWPSSKGPPTSRRL